MLTIQEYFDTLRGKSIAVIGMGVSNTPLIRMMLRAGLKVTVCDKAPREKISEQARELESLGARLRLGPDYLSKLYKFDLIFRTPGLQSQHAGGEGGCGARQRAHLRNGAVLPAVPLHYWWA